MKDIRFRSFQVDGIHALGSLFSHQRTAGTATFFKLNPTRYSHFALNKMDSHLYTSIHISMMSVDLSGSRKPNPAK
jgi:hypothetical protein